MSSQPGHDLLTDPVRFPAPAPAPVRNRRAVLLLLLTLFIPGSAQIVAGDRRLGRRALRVTLLCWAALAAVAVVAVLDRSLLFDLVTGRWWSLVLVIVLAALAAGWAFLFLNTLRIIRPVLLAPGMKRAVTGTMVALMVLTSGSLGYGAYLLNTTRGTFGNIFASGPALKPVDGRYNFLLMGGDAGADRMGRRPDSISVFSVDAKTGQTTTFSIPRNFQNAPFPDGSPLKKVYPDGYNCGDTCIINSLYQTVMEHHQDLYPDAADPGAAAMMDAASGVLGIKIQAYVLVDMAGFAQLIDAMGGITINAGGWVPITAGEIPGTDRHYPPDGWIAPGVQKLDGYHALWYARSREFASDYARIQRQQCVQQAMLKQLDPATVLTRFQAILAAGEQIVESDLPQGQLGSFVNLAVKAKNFPLTRLTIGPPDFGTAADNFVTYPDIALIHQRVQDVLAAAPQAAAPAALAPALERASFVPAAKTPEITEQYLQRLAKRYDTDKLIELVGNNGECSVP